jgi:hypothetical protein
VSADDARVSEYLQLSQVVFEAVHVVDTLYKRVTRLLTDTEVVLLQVSKDLAVATRCAASTMASLMYAGCADVCQTY